MNNICVFCGSSKGNDGVFSDFAYQFGIELAKNNKTLIYGGGNVGLMGIIADATIENGGSAIGVIPDFLLQREVGHAGLTKLLVVESMHERKQKMAEMADAFVAMPGGFGTLEELAETLTWVQLGIMNKPVALLNVNGFYNSFLQQLDTMVDHGFLSKQNRRLLLSVPCVEDIIPHLTAHISVKAEAKEALRKT